MATFGIIEKTEPVEKDSPLLPMMDAWIEHEKTLDTASGAKATLEDEFDSLRAARKFQADIQLAARQRDRGFRTYKFEALDEKGKLVKPNEDGKYTEAQEAKVTKVIVGGTLGARKRRQGAAKAAAEGNAEA